MAMPMTLTLTLQLPVTLFRLTFRMVVPGLRSAVGWQVPDLIARQHGLEELEAAIATFEPGVIVSVTFAHAHGAHRGERDFVGEIVV